MDESKKIAIHLKSLKKVTCELFSKAMLEIKNIDSSISVDEKKQKVYPLQNVLQSKSNGVNKLYDRLIDLTTEEATVESIMQESIDFEIYSKENLHFINEFVNKCQLDEKKFKSSTTVEPKRFETSIKLPRIEIKRFGGELTQWKSFIDTFEAAIHKSSLSNAEKFNYLKGYLQENASKTIEGLSLTNENYPKALELLKDRYGNTQMIISAHMGELLKLQPITKEDDVSSLRLFYDEIEAHVRSLLSLGVDSKNYGALLSPIIMERLPNELRLIISRNLKGEGWDLTRLLEILREELKARETCILPPSENSEVDIPYTQSALFTKSKPTPQIKCLFCRGPHYSDKCDIVTDLQTRKDHVKKLKRCFICLKPDHTMRNCTSTRGCYYCKGKHNSAICDKRESPKGTTNLHVRSETSVLLQTAQVYITSKSGNQVKVRALLDSGSQKSFISKRIRNILKLPTKGVENLTIATFGKNEPNITKVDCVEFSIKGMNKPDNILMKAYSVSTICLPLCDQPIQYSKQNYEHIKDLNLADAGEGELDVDLLIGSDFYWSILSGKVLRGDGCGPVALDSKVGWILSGSAAGNQATKQQSINLIYNSTPTHVVCIETNSNNDSIESKLSKFWDLETLGICDNENHPDQVFLNDIKVNSEGRYEVQLPFKANHPVLSDNFELAEKRLRNTLKRLKSNPKLLKLYDDVFQEQKQFGIIEPANKTGTSGETHYLPHHAVIKENKQTSKVRIVFDASSKVRGPSLNDCLHKGPQLTPLLFDILLRFRSFAVALTADIEKAFLQISIAEDDRDYLRFLWFEDVFQDEPKIVRNRFARVVFGVNSSPFLLNGTIRKHASNYLDIDAEFVEKVMKSFYVDDCISGESSTEKAFQLFKKLKTRFLEGLFCLRKWRTNDPDLRQQIYSIEETEPIESSQEKILGIVWDENADIFKFDLSELIEAASAKKPTKRNILSILSSFYDPLGLIQPIIVSLKLLFQNICKRKFDWDDEISDDLKETWFSLINNLKHSNIIQVPRPYIITDVSNPVVECELHGFSDASEKAYGANIYLRSQTKSGAIQVTLVASKSRVSPIKCVTIPRLELLGNLLLSRLMLAVINALDEQYQFTSLYYWTDSQVSLSWIKSFNKEYKAFVQNRIDEIRKNTDTNFWNYCKTTENPADLITRSNTSPSVLSCNKLWWEGPSFLKNSKDQWLKEKADQEKRVVNDIELKTNTVAMVTLESNVQLNKVIEIENFSTLTRLIRVTAWVLRFVKNLKMKISKTETKLSATLSTTDLSESKELWVKDNQKTLHGADFENVKKQLNIVKDDRGIYRCQGRLHNAPLPYQTRFPAILNQNHRLAELIVLEKHLIVKHARVKQTLTELRQEYWVCKGRSFVRKLLRMCVTCKKLSGKPYSYPAPPPLTQLRLDDSRPFAVVGVDNCGPLFVRNIYGSSDVTMFKAWIVLFTCAASRGVVLDLVPDMGAGSFVRSLNRLVSRRGCPNDIISDNGRNFIAELTQNHASSLNIKWHFNIPLAPWYGGFFERLIRTVKGHLKKQLHNARLNYDEMMTVLLEIELIVNNRPITYVYPNELQECLTPNHLLFSRRLESRSLTNHESPLTVANLGNSPHINQLLEHFWNRWRQEYLTELRVQHKNGSKKGQSISLNDIVLVHDDKLPRSLWRIGKVTKLIMSQDNKVRGADVSLPNSSTLKRPVCKLYPIESEYSHTDNATNISEPVEQVDNEQLKGARRSTRREAAIVGELKRKYLV